MIFITRKKDSLMCKLIEKDEKWRESRMSSIGSLFFVIVCMCTLEFMITNKLCYKT